MKPTLPIQSINDPFVQKGDRIKEDPGTQSQSNSDFLSRPLSLLMLLLLVATSLYGQRHMEKLGRGLVAVRNSESEVFVSWRLLGTDPDDIAFNLYRGETQLNSSPITGATNFTDNTSSDETYTVRPVLKGVEQAASAPASVWAQPYLSIPLQRPAGGTTPDGVSYTYSPNDASVGDLDGDGEYEIVLKWDPSNSKDNSQSGYTGNVYIDAYKLDGTRMWRMDLGKNIRAGAHYTQFIVYDLDSDGKAEVAFKTADGTVDGTGTVIGNAGADYRNPEGRILYGPEYLTIFNGETGAAMATTDYVPARGKVSDWGDDYGNRVDRFLAGVGYFDGTRPSLLMTRGYYTRSVLVAWDWRNGQLTQRWIFDSDDEGNSAYAGQGDHSLSINDVDGDGKDEVVFGSMTVDDDGTGLYSSELGHGDALHAGDLNPDRPGQEIWTAHEVPSAYDGNGLWLRDAQTGEKLWGVPADRDVGRALAADIDPRYKGYEVWGSVGNLYSITGEEISTTKPASANFANWWDGDLQREILDGTTLDKWNYSSGSSERLLTASDFGAASNNGTKANPGLSGDILGDWREEIIYRHSNNTELLIFATTTPTNHRFYTFMHDPQYRVSVAWQNVAYNQPPHTSFYVGEGMDTPPTPAIAQVENDGPGTPIIYLAASAGDSQVDLSWSVTNLELSSLEVYRDTDPDPNGRVRITSLSGTSRTYTDTDVQNDNTYYYWIKGKDANSEITNSNTANATPAEEGSGGDLPGIELTASTADSQVELSWTVTKLELTNQEVYRDTDPNPSGRTRIASVSGDSRSFNDITVQDGVTYYYWIKATDVEGSVTNSNTASVTAVVEGDSKIPDIALDASAGDSQIDLSWTVSNIDLMNQEIFRDTDPDPSGRVRIASIGTESRSYTDNTAENGTTYYYWIKAADVNGTVTNSNAASATPQPPASIILEASAGDAQLELNWTVSYTELTYQEVYRDTDPDPNGRVRIAKMDGNGRTYVDNTVENGVTYYYWIKGRDVNNLTINSNAANGTLEPLTLDGTYMLTARHSAKVLDVNNGGAVNSRYANVVQQTADGSSKQQWIISSVAEGYYSITNMNSGKALGVEARSGKAEGANILQWDYSGDAGQQWEINDLGNGYYNIINRFSGQSVSVEASSAADGANVKQWTYSGGENQEFSLTAVSANMRTANAADQATKVSFQQQEQTVSTLIYPNPSSREFMIKTAGAFEYIIFDQLSRTVEKGNAEGSLRVGNDLKSGLYIINIQTGGKQQQFKLIKK